MEYETPNPRIHFFTGTLTIHGGAAQGAGGDVLDAGEGGGGGVESREVPVDQSNLLLRGARLRNTKWALGVVAYTGKESKIAQNARSVPSKQSNLDKVGSARASASGRQAGRQRWWWREAWCVGFLTLLMLLSWVVLVLGLVVVVVRCRVVRDGVGVGGFWRGRIG